MSDSRLPLAFLLAWLLLPAVLAAGVASPGERPGESVCAIGCGPGSDGQQTPALRPQGTPSAGKLFTVLLVPKLGHSFTLGMELNGVPYTHYSVHALPGGLYEIFMVLPVNSSGSVLGISLVSGGSATGATLTVN